MRLTRLWAIAVRDWRSEFSGREGLLLPGVAAFILLPLATAPEVERPEIGQHEIRVSGDVPDSVLDLDRVRVTDVPTSRINFVKSDGGRLTVRGNYIPKDIRAALDADQPTRTILMENTLSLPNRSLFLALIGASILTGAISQTVPGERSTKTLSTLMTAAVSRRELVLGKWLAWTLFGAGAALFAAFSSIALGRQPAGPWLLAMPWVAAGTVALGLWLVRRAADVIGGATIALRVLPATLTALGLMAYWLGNTNPLLGAALPLGGALVASGGAWEGWTPPLVAVLSTGMMTLGCLLATSRDLDSVERTAMDHGFATTAGVIGIGVLTWWTPILGPEMWALGGNRAVVASLAPAEGIAAASLGLALLLVVQAARSSDVLRQLGLLVPRSRLDWLLALVAGPLLVAASGLDDLLPVATDPRWHALGQRAAAALDLGWTPLLIGVAGIVTQELLFRGWLQHRVGATWAALAFVGLMGTASPLHALVLAGLCGALTHKAGGSVGPAILARMAALALSASSLL